MSPSPPIYRQNKDSVRVFLVNLVLQAIDYFNIRQMAEHQVVHVVSLIMEDPDYHYLKPEDFKVCFDNGMKGRYGQLYNRFDGGIIFEWLRLYSADREESIIQHQIELKNKRQKEEQEKIEKVKEGIKIIRQKMEVIEKPPPPPPPKPDPIKEKINKIYAEFDKLYKEQGMELKEGARFVKYKDKVMDIQEFVNLRIEEVVCKIEE